MATLDAKTEALLGEFTRQVRELYGEDLLAVVLYGSAAGVDYIPEVSDLNLLVVLKEVNPAQLEKAHKLVGRWRKAKLSPLFLDPHYIQRSLDVFPIEFLEMKEQHRLLWGEEDPLEGLEIPQENLRWQCEQELKGKWLKLRQAYLQTAGNPKGLQGLLVGSLRSFGVVMSALLRLKGLTPPPREFLEIVTQVEEAFGLELPAFREVYQLKWGFISPDKAALRELFARYLVEVRQLTEVADTLFAEADPAK